MTHFSISKVLTIVMVLVGTLTFAQSVNIDTLRITKPTAYEGHVKSIMFPIIKSGNATIDSIINTDLKDRFTIKDYKNIGTEVALNQWLTEGLEHAAFKINSNQNGIISLHISAEACGAYCSNWTTNYNYSTTTGKYLTLSDVITLDTDFKEKIALDKEAQYTQMLTELKERLEGPNADIDQKTYNWALESYEASYNYFNLENFALFPNAIEITYECEFPHVIRSLGNTFKFNYKYTQIKKYMKIHM